MGSGTFILFVKRGLLGNAPYIKLPRESQRRTEGGAEDVKGV